MFLPVYIYIYIDMVVVAGAPLIPHVPHERSHGREQIRTDLRKLS